jgi:GNAT superfamily N-acetyltransferase
MASSHSPVVRRAVESDGHALLTLIDALAGYEKLAPPSPAARERLLRDMFGPDPRIDSLLVFMDGYPVGYAIILETYSSFLALPTLYLEDLFVVPEYRGRKAGFALFQEVKAEAVRRGCGRLEWTVLDWNRLAIDFYKRLGGEHLKEWQHFRITF